MSLTYLKGRRTKHRKSLDTAVVKAQAILQSGSLTDPTELATTASLLKASLSRFEGTLEKLSLQIDAIPDDEAKRKEEQDLQDAVSAAADAEQALDELSALQERAASFSGQPAEQFSAPSMSADPTVLELLTRLTNHATQPPQVAGMPAQPSASSPSASTVAVEAQQTVKLPTLNIPSFSGDVLQWISFWDAFHWSIDSHPTLSDIDKFNYLLTKLSGEARSSVSGLTLSNANYNIAVAILKERFGDTQVMVDAHYVTLMDLPPATSATPSLRTLYDSLEKHFRSLIALDQDVEQSVFVSMITSKIPRSVLIQMEMTRDQTVAWTTTSLRKAFGTVLTATESADRRSGPAAQPAAARTISQILADRQTNIPTASAEALAAGAHGRKDMRPSQPKTACLFCKSEKKHWMDACPQ